MASVLPTPIRVGFIGLGSNPRDGFVPGQWGRQHLASFLASPHYQIVALSNSSLEAAKRAVQVHGLPASTKTYASAADLAADPDVDLVLVSVMVNKHRDLAKPVLEAGATTVPRDGGENRHKSIYVEWPLGANLAEAEELAALARAKGDNIKAVVGLQARSHPVVKRLRDIVQNGKIGDVVSASLQSSMTILAGDGWIESLKGYLQMGKGNSRFYVNFAHTIDAFVSVVGPLTNVQALFKNVEKTAPLMSDATGEVTDPAFPITAPDSVFVQGLLPGTGGGLASFTFRTTRGVATGSDGFRWTITGRLGEVSAYVPGGVVQMADSAAAAGAKITLKTWAGKTTGAGGYDEAEVDVPPEFEDEPAYVRDIPQPGTNTARSYEALAVGDDKALASFEDALQTHRLLDEIAKVAVVAP